MVQLTDLQERSSLQARDLFEAQQQRKLAVMEFTDVNEKVNELRSKNYKLASDMLAREDEIDELKRQLSDVRSEVDKRERLIEDLRAKIESYVDKIAKQETESKELAFTSQEIPINDELLNEVVLVVSIFSNNACPKSIETKFEFQYQKIKNIK